MMFGGLSYIVEIHQFFPVQFACLIQGHEADVLWWKRFVREWALNRIEIMGSDGDKSSLAGEILMELILQGDERFIPSLVESDISQNSTGNVGSNFGCLYMKQTLARILCIYYEKADISHIFFHNEFLQLAIRWRDQSIVGEFCAAKKDV